GIAHANAIERVKDIRPELDAIADSAEGRRAFEHAYRLPLARERERGGQPAKPATDDEDRVLQDQSALLFSCSQRRLNGLLHIARRHGSIARPFHARKRGWKRSQVRAERRIPSVTSLSWLVMPGLDPGIHASQQSAFAKKDGLPGQARQ